MSLSGVKTPTSRVPTYKTKTNQKQIISKLLHYLLNILSSLGQLQEPTFAAKNDIDVFNFNLKYFQTGMTATGGKKGFIDQYFGGDYVVEMKCTESEEEPATKSTETFYQMSCFIEKGERSLIG